MKADRGSRHDQRDRGPVLTLHDGVEIPQLGFGVFQVPPEETQEVVEEALAAGYRHIDTAAAYRNEAGVGAAIAASGLRREEVFVTTKLWNSEQGYDSTLARLREEPRAARPRPRRPLPDPLAGARRRTATSTPGAPSNGSRRKAAPARSASPTSASRTSSGCEREAERLPTVNQIELHPRLQQAELRAWHAEHDVATEAWSPLAQGALLDDETIETVAAHHDRTPAQAILRWHLQLGNVVIPKSVDPGADPRELRGLRLRAERGRHGRDRPARRR